MPKSYGYYCEVYGICTARIVNLVKFVKNTLLGQHVVEIFLIDWWVYICLQSLHFENIYGIHINLWVYSLYLTGLHLDNIDCSLVQTRL